MSFDELPTDIRGYHRRTKHAPNRYALGPAFLDWESQPNPFRRFEGARLAPLPLRLDATTPDFGTKAAPQPVNADTLGLFLELALGLSAWKEAGESRWALRNNPSSGNLHPTEGWVALPALAGIGAAPALYHYAPREHGLEERARLDGLALPEGAFLFALSSIPWREEWKYGERAFRYCQHDVGHALAATSYAAACLGWRVRVLEQPGDNALSALLGLDRADAHHAYETEHADLVALVSPRDVSWDWQPPQGQFAGAANPVSEDHDRWPVIERALVWTHRPDNAPCPAWEGMAAPDLAAPAVATAQVIRKRRSAQRMKKGVGMDKQAFFRLLAASLPDPSRFPWDAFPWPPRLALFLMVHQVEGLEPGLYALIRDPDSLDALKAACDSNFSWVKVEGPLPLYALAVGEMRQLASGLSCLQAIAGHGAFSLGMVAEFGRTLRDEGDWAYRRLFWESGMIGQVLYLEATAAGLSGTGIGCFFDDEVHSLLGINGAALEWQSLYHFTVGEAMEDGRIQTLPAYAHLER